jgi:hypothetical protein
MSTHHPVIPLQMLLRQLAYDYRQRAGVFSAYIEALMASSTVLQVLGAPPLAGATSTASAPVLSIAANGAHQVTWCCIQKLCDDTGDGAVQACLRHDAGIDLTACVEALSLPPTATRCAGPIITTCFLAAGKRHERSTRARTSRFPGA